MFSMIRFFIAELFSTMQFVVEHCVDFLEFTAGKILKLIAYVIHMYSSIFHAIKTGIDILQCKITQPDDHINEVTKTE